MRHEHYFHHKPEECIEHRLDALLTIGRQIMSAISDFAAKQKAFNTEVSDDLDAITIAIGALNDKITALQDSAGTVTPEDQALIDQLQADGNTLTAKADALAGKTPPASACWLRLLVKGRTRQFC